MSAVVVASFRSATCPDPGECEVVVAGELVGWDVLAGCALTLICSLKRACDVTRIGHRSR